MSLNLKFWTVPTLVVLCGCSDPQSTTTSESGDPEIAKRVSTWSRELLIGGRWTERDHLGPEEETWWIEFLPDGRYRGFTRHVPSMDTGTWSIVENDVICVPDNQQGIALLPGKPVLRNRLHWDEDSLTVEKWGFGRPPPNVVDSRLVRLVRPTAAR